MTFKHLIASLKSKQSSEAARLRRLKRHNPTLRTVGRVQGLGIAIRLAERMREERLSV
jgi:hypothetical protein